MAVVTSIPRAELPVATERPLVRSASFTALALYGVARWTTLSTTPPVGRLLGLAAVAVGLGMLGPLLARRGRGLAAVVAVVAVIAAFPLAGIPVAWIVHHRIGLIADTIAQGVGGLPRVLLPYSGVNDSVQIVVTLGAAALLLDAGLLLAFAPAALGDARRAGVALPLIALAVIPSTLIRPTFPYLQGALLFGLLAVFLWGERVRSGEIAAVLGTCLLAGVAAFLIAPALDRRQPWIDPHTLAGSFAPKHLERFDWSQGYGPLNWPRNGRPVLEVQAAHADYWKAENLDVFNGRGWAVATAAPPTVPDRWAGVSASTRARWTQTIKVTLGPIATSTVIAAGSAAAPLHAGALVLPGASAGTWVTGTPLGPGDSYSVTTYDPDPTPAQLAAAGAAYPDQVASYRTVELPSVGSPSRTVGVVFPSFQSGFVAEAPAGGAAVAASPYARAYALATRLAGQASTPYAFVIAVQRYLSHGYTYDESPPASQYPLESFLFKTRIGYCQQFAGAMALLLRMGGIPARVADGFTSGSDATTAHQFVVTDIDAHAWVEAWFPHYGWVRFDPTPTAAPARGGRSPIAASPAFDFASHGTPAGFVRHATTPAAAVAASRHARGSSAALPVIAVVLGALLVAAVTALAVRRRRPPGAEALLAELERSLARAGRPLTGGMTLAALEDRFRVSPDASAYVRAIRLARFGAGGEPPRPHERRALRAQLRAGLGIGGALRALWALPPGWPRAKTSPHSRRRGIHS